MQKKALVHLVGIPLIVIIPALLTGIYFTRTNNDLRERAEQLESQLAQIGIDLESATRTNSELTSKLLQAGTTIEGLERTASGLRESNRLLRERIGYLEDTVQGILGAIGELEGTASELADIIRESIAILQGISDRGK